MIQDSVVYSSRSFLLFFFKSNQKKTSFGLNIIWRLKKIERLRIKAKVIY